MCQLATLFMHLAVSCGLYHSTRGAYRSQVHRLPSSRVSRVELAWLELQRRNSASRTPDRSFIFPARQHRLLHGEVSFRSTTTARVIQWICRSVRTSPHEFRRTATGSPLFATM